MPASLPQSCSTGANIRCHRRDLLGFHHGAEDHGDAACEEGLVEMIRPRGRSHRHEAKMRSTWAPLGMDGKNHGEKHMGFWGKHMLRAIETMGNHGKLNQT